MANEAGNIGGGAMTGAGIGTMFMPGVGTAIGAGAGGLLGIIKSIIDSDNEKKDRISQATTTRYSPWTGLRAREVERTNTLGDVMAGISGGAQLGQGIQKSNADNSLTQAIAARLSGGAAQSGQQQGASTPIVTQAESGKSAAPVVPVEAMGEPTSGLGEGGDLDQMLKLMRIAKAGRSNYSGMA